MHFRNGSTLLYENLPRSEFTDWHYGIWHLVQTQNWKIRCWCFLLLTWVRNKQRVEKEAHFPYRVWQYAPLCLFCKGLIGDMDSFRHYYFNIVRNIRSIFAIAKIKTCFMKVVVWLTLSSNSRYYCWWKSAISLLTRAYIESFLSNWCMELPF